MSLVIQENEIASLPITIDPEILGGTPVFRGTRVPVDALLNNLEAGVSIDDFLENFPTVSRKQVLEVIRFSGETLRRLLSLSEDPAGRMHASRAEETPHRI
jgi:uncharacterized protein (DUF433 family)